jgi:hypothetical protein
MTEDVVLYSNVEAVRESFTWWQAWWYSMARPTVEMYEKLVDDPKATKTRSFVWLILCVVSNLLIGMLIGVLFSWLIMTMAGNPRLLHDIEGALTGSLVSFVIAVPVFAAVILFYIWLCHIIARLLGGKGDFWKLVYAQAVYLMPYTVATVIGSFIPVVGFFVFLLPFYILYLDVVGVKAVHKISWGRSAAAGIIPFVLSMILFGVVIAVLIMALPAGSFQHNIPVDIQGLLPLFNLV